MNKIILFLLIIPLLATSQSKNDSIFNDNDNLTEVNKIELSKLINKYEKKLLTTNGIIGWRVQIKFTSKREEIHPYQIKFKKLFPEIPVQIIFDSPYYKLTVGNFRKRNEALKVKDLISTKFPGAHHIKCVINPRLIIN
jgi:transcription antitermination factor NusA-like protein